MTYLPAKKCEPATPTTIALDGTTSHSKLGRMPALGKHDDGGPLVVQGQDTENNPRGHGGDVVLQGGIGPAGAGGIVCRSGHAQTLPSGTLITIPIFCGKKETNGSEWVELGAAAIDILSLPSARSEVTFEAVLCSDSAMVPAEVELRDVTNGETILQVQTKNTTPTAVGGAVALAHGKGVYVARVRSGEGGKDASSTAEVSCYGAVIHVRYR